MTHIVISNDTSEGSHSIAENVVDINIKSGSGDLSRDLPQILWSTLPFENESSNRSITRGTTLISKTNPMIGESPGLILTAINTHPPLLARLPLINADVVANNDIRQSLVSISNQKDGAHGDRQSIKMVYLAA